MFYSYELCSALESGPTLAFIFVMHSSCRSQLRYTGDQQIQFLWTKQNDCLLRKINGLRMLYSSCVNVNACYLIVNVLMLMLYNRLLMY